MKIFAGECHLGPLDGQMLAHWSNVKKFYRPMMGWSMNVESSPVEAIEIGEYQYLADATGKSTWFWRETDAGRAYRKLFDKDDEILHHSKR